MTHVLYDAKCGVEADYWASDADPPDPAFLEDTAFRFCIDRVNEHFHLPFNFAP